MDMDMVLLSVFVVVHVHGHARTCDMYNMCMDMCVLYMCMCMCMSHRLQACDHTPHEAAFRARLGQVLKVLEIIRSPCYSAFKSLLEQLCIAHVGSKDNCKYLAALEPHSDAVRRSCRATNPTVNLNELYELCSLWPPATIDPLVVTTVTITFDVWDATHSYITDPPLPLYNFSVHVHAPKRDVEQGTPSRAVALCLHVLPCLLPRAHRRARTSQPLSYTLVAHCSPHATLCACTGMCSATRLRGGGDAALGSTNLEIPPATPTADGILAAAEATARAPDLFLLFTGEGAHAVETDVASLKNSPSWAALQHFGLELSAFLSMQHGNHAAPNSPMVTTILNICNADRWRTAGYTPTLVLGHSIGKVAAAYTARLLCLGEALRMAHVLGQAGSERQGAMMHARWTRRELDAWTDDELCIAAINGVSADGLFRVTLCGPADRVDAWMGSHLTDARQLAPPHPWHYRAYLDVPGMQDGSQMATLPMCRETESGTATFLSATRQQVHLLDVAYWREWLTTPVNFQGALERATSLLNNGCYLIETGAHPVLLPVAIETLRACGVRVMATAASMRRGQPAAFWEAQRSVLDAALAPRASVAPVATHLCQRDAVEAQICALLAESFAHVLVDVDAPLMAACGLDSCDAPVVADALNAAFDVQLPPTLILECGTVRAIATRLVLECGMVRPPPSAPHAMQAVPQGVALESGVGRGPGAPRAALFVPLAAAAGDAVLGVPALRWSTTNVPPAASYGGFLSCAQRFDHGAFGVSPAEAGAMDPQQRLLLEIGYEATHGAAMRRGGLLGRDVGIFVGLMNTDFAQLAGSASVYAATGTQLSIVAGRMSFALGTHGPCASLDTACSSALVALDAATLSLRASDASLAAAANLLLAPLVSLLFARAGMLSVDGRCKTFDARANGYVRAEGIGAITLGAGAAAYTLAGVAVRADGKSASLTAPNGSAQARMIGAALAVVGSAALHLIEAHGTGTPLGDPTEVSALERTLGSIGACLGAVKASLGHAEPVAGLAGLLAIALSLTHGAGSTNAMLRTLNPMLVAQLHGLKAYVPSNGVLLVPSNDVAGVSSFGYSGTIAHALMRGGGSFAPMPTPVAYRRRAFAWIELAHPFAQRRLSAAGASITFRSPTAGVLRSLVSDHIVRGRVVFPAAAYLEMARSAATPDGGARGMSLTDVGFVAPLDVDSIVEVDIVMRIPEMMFEVCSTAEAAVAMHCTGRIGASSARPPTNDNLPCKPSDSARARATEGVFKTFHAVGLQYGPAYRRLVQVVETATHRWAKVGRRTRLERTLVHPGDIDAVLQLYVLPTAGTQSELFLPFAVDEATLHGSFVAMTAVTGRAGRAQLLGASGGATLQADLTGVRARSVAAHRMAPTKTPRHLYSTEWQSLVPSSSEQVSAPLLLLCNHATQMASAPAVGYAASRQAPAFSAVVMAATAQQHAERLHALLALEGVFTTVQLRASSSGSSRVPLWLITHAQSAAGAMEPMQVGVWGMVRSMRAEMPLPLRCMEAPIFAAAAHAVSRVDEPEAALHASEHLAPRLHTARVADIGGAVRLHFHARGAISNLFLESQQDTSEADATAGLELRVRAVGLNFRDVLNVLGEYPGGLCEVEPVTTVMSLAAAPPWSCCCCLPAHSQSLLLLACSLAVGSTGPAGDPGMPGTDSAGVVLNGDASTLHPADKAVFGLANAPLASTARATALLLASKPAALHFVHASTLPVPWSTAHAVLERTGACASQRLVIHATAGGVGLNAFELAQWLGLSAAGSAGRPYKHALLRCAAGCTPSSLCTSRDSAAFAYGLGRLALADRFHAVLNSLSADFISASFASLQAAGAYAEVGKRNVWSRERRLAAAAHVLYHVIALDSEWAAAPAWMHSVFVRLSARADAGVIAAPPLRSFDLFGQAQLAFRTLSGGLSIGKVVLRIVGSEAAGCRHGHVVTGGTGGLGLLTARWLATRGATHLVLASRSGALQSTASEGAALLTLTTAAVHPVCFEAGDATSTRALVALDDPVAAVWHAAGVLADCLLSRQSAPSLACSYAPKACGAWALQRASALKPLSGFTTFSSVVALLGNLGQSNYGAANSCLDALSCARRAAGEVSVSVQWGAWADIGMAATRAAMTRVALADERSGFGRIKLAHGLLCLHVATRPSGMPVLGAVPIVWSRLLGDIGTAPAFLVTFASTKSGRSGFTAAESVTLSLEAILEVAQRTARGGLDADVPLMAAGVDSLGAVELRNQLQSAAGADVMLPTALVFDHPTARQLAIWVGRTVKKSNAPLALRPRVQQKSLMSCGRASIVGESICMPTGIMGSAAAWLAGTCSIDAIIQVPSDRWNVSASASTGSRARHGGFVLAADRADPVAFGLSSTEVAAMDPQQRLLLEHGYAALHSGHMDCGTLQGSLTAIFVGVTFLVFEEVLLNAPQGASVYAATGSGHSIASGRLAYTLGTHGPCLSIDTACSAALAACQAASTALQRTDCSRALAAGVNLMLSPVVSSRFALAGMTSPRGRCHTLDARADGYARAESCCSIALRSQYRVVVALSGSVRQDGRSASLTAPNGSAQQDLICDAMVESPVDVDALGVNEMHGTGTALGDPIEAGSLAAAVLHARAPTTASLLVGGVKANVGHAEPAAGMTGLLCTCQRSMRTSVPNAQLRARNPFVIEPLGGLNVTLPVQLARAHDVTLTASGVSSFGYSGTIVHVVLQSSGTAGGAAIAARWSCRRRSFPWNAASCTAATSTAAGLAQAMMPLDPSQRQPHVQAVVLRLVTRLCGRHDGILDADVPLVEEGLDSLGMTEVAAQLQKLSGVPLPSTLVFAHPTPRSIAEHVLKELETSRTSSQGPVAVEARRSGDTSQIPLSSPQLSLLLHQLLQPQIVAYNEPLYINLAASLTEPATRTALQMLVLRHPVLRTHFRLNANDRHCQTVLPKDGFVVPLVYCTDEAQWEAEHERALHAPFDLLAAPPIRAVAFQPTAPMEPPKLMVLVHHVAADMVAMQIIRDELAQLCDALTLDRPLPTLPPLQTEYADFAMREQGRGHDDDALSWWNSLLGRVPALVTLPLDHERPAVQDATAGHVDMHFSKQLTEGLMAWRRANSITLIVALVTVWAALLQYLSEQPEVVVGIPHSMRCAPFLTTCLWSMRFDPLLMHARSDALYAVTVRNCRRS